MIRSIEIDDKMLTLKSSVYTWFTYKAGFGAELPEDMARAIAIDGQRTKELDDVTRAALLGQEMRLFLQLLWAFASEGTPGLPPFEQWVQDIENIDITAVINAITELYTATIKPDRRNRGSGNGDSGATSTEVLADMLLDVGVSISDMKNITVGQAINIIREHVRRVQRSKGEQVSDPDKQYKQIKEIVELIESGKVTDYDPKEFEELKKALREWEDG